MSPVPFVTAESGMKYDKNGDMTPSIRIYTDYSDYDKASFIEQPLFKPMEYLRVVQGELELTSQGTNYHDFDGLYG